MLFQVEREYGEIDGIIRLLYQHWPNDSTSGSVDGSRTTSLLAVHDRLTATGLELHNSRALVPGRTLETYRMVNP
jgi:hypothetical protein